MAVHPRGVLDQEVGTGPQAADGGRVADGDVAVADQAQMAAARGDQSGAGIQALAAGCLPDLQLGAAVQARRPAIR